MLERSNQYVCTERLDWTAGFIQSMEEMNQSSCSGSISSRIVGFVGTPFISLAETLAHGTMAVGKTCTGLVVSPYNCLANTCFPEHSLPQNLEFSSALIHLILAIESICTAILLPFVCLLNPSRADAWINSLSTNPQENVEVNSEVEQLQEELQTKEKLIKKNEKSIAKRSEKLLNANNSNETLREENLRLNEQLKNLPKQGDTDYILEVFNLQKELKTKEAEHAEMIKELNAENQNRCEELIKEKIEIENKLIIRYSKFVEELQGKVKEITSEKDSAVEDLKQVHSRNFKVFLEELTKKESKLKNFYENKIELLASEKSNQIKTFTIEKDKIIESLMNEYSENENKLTEYHIGEIQQLMSKNKNAIKQIVSEKDKEIQKLLNELEATDTKEAKLRNQHDSEINSLKQKIGDLENKVKEIEVSNQK